MEALEAGRKIVHDKGRSTSRAARGERNPRPRQVEREMDRPIQGHTKLQAAIRANRAAGKDAVPKPPLGIQQDDFDDLAAYRRR